MINRRILRTGVVAAAMAVVFGIFAFRAADWTKGLNSEFLVYGQVATSSGGTSGGSSGGTSSGGTVVPSATRVVSQVAAGAFDSTTTYGTIIEIVNPSISSITVNGNFYNEDGTAATLTFGTNLLTQPTVGASFTNITLAASSILILSVGTTSATVPLTGSVTWGLISASGTISVSSFFELRNKSDGALLSRVGIESSSPSMTSFVIPRIREKQATGSTKAEIDTGFAVVNTGTKTATITGSLIDANGNHIATMAFLLPANAHKAGIASSAFTYLNPENSGRQYQYMIFNSDQPTIGAASIALESGTFTRFPVTPNS